MNIPFMNPLFRLIATQPNLIASHVESYARMFSEEISAISQGLKRRIVLGVCAVALLLMSLMFAGIGLLLWGTLTQLRDETRWILIVVPSVPLILSAAFFFMLSSHAKQVPLSKVKSQFKEDLAMLHDTGAL
jgi:uncharacterized membrane protein YqhA